MIVIQTIKQLCAVAVFFTLFSISHAATIESTTNFGYWYAPNTWVGGVVPSSDDDVVINGTIQINGSRTVNNITVRPGANLSFTSNGQNLTVNGILENQGIINNSRAPIQLYSGFIGNPTSNALEWYAGEGIWQPSAPTALALRSNFITGTSTSFSTLIPNGYYVSLYNQPEISIASTAGTELQIFGQGTVTVTGTPNFSRIIAPNSDMTWTVGGRSSGTYQAKTLTLSDTDTAYNIVTGTEITAETVFVLPDVTVTSGTGQFGGYTNDLIINGDLFHDGHIANKVNLLVGGDIYGSGTYDYTSSFSSRGIHRLTWNDVGDSYEYIISDTHNLLSSATPTVTTLPQTADIRTLLTSYDDHYFIYRADGGRWSDMRTINVTPETISVPDDYFAFDLVQDVTLPNQATITIYAQDPEFAGPVTLSAHSGQVYPVAVSMNNGTWTGNIEFFEGQGNQKLHVSGTGSAVGKSGESNEFDVIEQTQLNGIITGTVRRNSDGTPAAALVYVKNRRGGRVDSIALGAGEYELEVSGSGIYDLYADGVIEKLGTVNVRENQIIIKDLSIAESCSEAYRVPVLLLPGIEGSDRVNHRGWFPELYRHTPEWDSGELEIHDPGPVGGLNKWSGRLRSTY